MAVDFEKLIKSIVTPLVMHSKSSSLTIAEEENEITIQVLVSEEDLGRVIGKGGRIASAIRTIVYAGASKEGKRVRIDIDAF